MEELARKGGWTGDISEVERREMRVVRYESQKGHMSYDEYVRWKEEAVKRSEKAADRSDVGRGRRSTKRTVGKRSRLEDDEDEEVDQNDDYNDDADGSEDGE